MKAFAVSVERISAKEALREGVKALQAAHIESASLDARLLLEHALGVTREQLLFKMDTMLSPEQADYFRALIAKRITHQPIAQILERREFFGLTFRVTPDVLDPRPDSETLIEVALKRGKDRNHPFRILDLGTGTGCLLLTLLYEFPHATGIGVDISDAALKIAGENAARLGLHARASFLPSHWCMQVEGRFDIIISNPPYIPTADIVQLAPEVAQFEPKLALDGGADGLNCYRVIIASLPRHLAQDGFAVLELGFGQQPAVEALVKEHGLRVAGTARDIHGIVRCVIITH